LTLGQGSFRLSTLKRSVSALYPFFLLIVLADEFVLFHRFVIVFTLSVEALTWLHKLILQTEANLKFNDDLA